MMAFGQEGSYLHLVDNLLLFCCKVDDALTFNFCLTNVPSMFSSCFVWFLPVFSLVLLLLFLPDCLPHVLLLSVFHSQVVAYLFAQKMLAPNKFFLLRGNHELRSVQEMFHFKS